VLFFDGVAGLAVMGLWLFCVLDAITTDAATIRNLPKVTWVFIVILFFEIGAIAWLIAGRPKTSQASQRSLPYKGNTGIPPEYDRPGRAAAGNPDDDAAFLNQLRVRAETQRKMAAEQAKRLREQEDRPPE
jgi:Phospholipase_D-nuclease N-terminal